MHHQSSRPRPSGLRPRFLTASPLGKPHIGFSSTWCFETSVTRIKAAWLPGPSRARVAFLGWKLSPCLVLEAPFSPQTPPCPCLVLSPLPAHPELLPRPPPALQLLGD